ncbi:ABC transporter ATP-binding protein [Ktedonobacter racemifer]|uniref:ABC transporter related protein n=1 Tax=Ktedonobacter racemifer DSM 44963 TaxID=485913 RepID=D6TY24_KTERA|nr:ATP-binding cassette domain-containing protein [Ktedonobacter racemifer]EFH85020.1 ABC transporter related protein [Ktedonobacter racemifer DSM 44963]
MPHHQEMRYTEPAQSHPKRPLIELHQVSKVYQTPSGAFTALREISLCVQRQECVAIVGKSGSGKSTLINLITGIDRPSTGEIIVAGTPIHRLRENQLALWRGRTVGIVFQFFQLLPTLTILENVMLPMDLCNTYARNRQERALLLLKQMGIAEQAQKLPAALSGASSSGQPLRVLWQGLLPGIAIWACRV